MVHYNKNISEWKELLDLLWAFPSYEGYINEPSDNWIEYLPSVIYEYPYEQKRRKFFPKETYGYYKNLYDTTEEYILKIIDAIDDLAAEEFNGGIPKCSPDTLNILQQILDIMQNEQITMPDITKFKQFLFDVKPITEYGWGYPFNGKELLSRFNNK